MTRRGSLLFSAPRAHYGGYEKTIEVLRQLDARGISYERIGRLVWVKFKADWFFVKLGRDGVHSRVKHIAGVDLREAKRLVDRDYGIGDHGI